MDYKLGSKEAIQFVNVIKPGHGWKGRMEHVVRSHAMKHVRRQQKVSPRKPPIHGQVNQTSRRKHRKSRIDNSYPSCRSCIDQVCCCSCTEPVLSRRSQLYAWKASQGSSPKAVPGEVVDYSWCEKENGTLARFQPTCHAFSDVEHRLLIHISSLCTPFCNGISTRFRIWAHGVKTLMGLAFSHKFVMHGILAWSTVHMYRMTGELEMMELTYRYRARCLQGLQSAIDQFSAENSDAVLAASVLLGWQATDAKSWTTFVDGTLTVAEAIVSREQKSYLVNGAEWVQESSEERLQEPQTVGMLRQDAALALAQLEAHLPPNPVYSDAVKNLIALVDPSQSPASPEKASDRSQLLNDMLFWLPTKCIPMMHTDPAAMLLIAYLHAIALIAEPITDVNIAHFQIPNIASIEACYQEISMQAVAGPVGYRERFQESLAIMEFPAKVARTSKASLPHGWDQLPEEASLEPQYRDYRATIAQTSTISVLQSCPVGLWHNLLTCD